MPLESQIGHEPPVQRVWKTEDMDTIDAKLGSMSGKEMHDLTDQILLDMVMGAKTSHELNAVDRLNLTPGDLGVWERPGFAQAYLDDLIIRSNESSPDEHKAQNIFLLRICAVERLPLAIKKAKIFCKYLQYLGTIIGDGKQLPCPHKVEALREGILHALDRLDT